MIFDYLFVVILATLGIVGSPAAGLTEAYPSLNTLNGNEMPVLPVVNLLPNGPLELHPYAFDENDKICTENTMLRATYDSFALPKNPIKLQIAFQGTILCRNSEGALNFRRGILFSVGPLDVLFDCNEKALIVSGGNFGEASVRVSNFTGSDEVKLSLTVDKMDSLQPLKICVLEGSTPAAPAVVPPTLIQYLTSQDNLLTNGGVVIGPRATYQPGARATIQHLFLFTAGSSAPSFGVCSSAETMDLDFGVLLQQSKASENMLPEIKELSSAAGGVVEVEQEVEIFAQAVGAISQEQGPLQLSLTVFGLPPKDCDASACGDVTFTTSSSSLPPLAQDPQALLQFSSSAQLTAAVKFPVPGRFLIRAQASNGFGAIVWKDMAIVVHKIGDLQKAAPCCRSTSYIVGHNVGRPNHRTFFRSETSRESAMNKLGWSEDYWIGADLESERLFDYSILAPVPQRYPIDVITCADVRVAGAGSPEIYGLLWGKDDVQGHGKKLTIVPEAFPWASGPSEANCESHWSNWPDAESSQYRRTLSGSNNSTCSVGCTTQGIQTLIRETGMVDQYNQALIQASHGKLAMSPWVRVLPEVSIAKDPDFPVDSNNFGYYDVPARNAVEQAPEARPWMRLVMAPLALHRVPKHRAWSDGLASGAATITKCFASMYYTVHETGHRMGFRHGQLYKLDAGHAAPADPLGPGSFVSDDSYKQRLDIMSCCKSDFGLYHRTVAGWFKDSKRVVLQKESLDQPSIQKFVLFPFDRAESKGKLLSLAVRRSDNEIILIGFRSASHWQESSSSQSQPEDARQNIRGLQVEYIYRDVNKGTTNWGNRSIIDFNVLHADFPDAVPSGPGEFSRQSQFAAMKESRSWFDPESRILLSFEKIAECQEQPEGHLQLYNYSIQDYYGFRGEWPGTESYQRSDYAGYSSLECAYVTVTTATEAPTGKLDISTSFIQSNGGTVGAQSADQSAVCINKSSNGVGAINATGLVNLQVKWGENDVVAVVWKDRFNRTVESLEISDQEGRFVSSSVTVQADALPLSVHVLAPDGRHTQAHIDMTLDEGTADDYVMHAQYRYYDTTLAITDSDKMALGVVPNCIQPLVAAREQRMAMMNYILFISGVAIGVSLLVVVCIVFLIWMVRRRRKFAAAATEEQSRENARRTATPAALAEAATATADVTLGKGK